MVKINKMIKNKTGASFLVVHVIYCSLVYTDSKKTVSCLLPRLPFYTIYASFKGNLKSMDTCMHTERLMFVPLCL